MIPQNEETTQEDLGIKLGSKAQAFWTNAKDKIERETEKAQYEIEINNHVVELCKKKIAEEEAKRPEAEKEKI